jgi:hypothetical protein
LILCPSNFGPFFDTVDVEDLEALAITVPSGIFGSNFLQTNHTFGLSGDQLLGQTVP